jgi:S1-C subfamily serine protease
MGVQVAPDQMARQLGLKGALVFDVDPDGPAAKAGLQPTRTSKTNGIQLGDVIVAIDKKPVRSANDLLDMLEEHQAGQTVQVTVLRDGKEHQTQITLAGSE